MTSKKNIFIISPQNIDVDSTKESTSYLGKKVMSKSGQYIGRIRELIIEGNLIRGAIIKKGLSKILVAWAFFEEESKDTLMLSIDPVSIALGKYVYDADGKKLGKVLNIKREDQSNKFSSIIIRKRFYSKPIIIPVTDIAVCKKNILLNKVYN